MWSHLARKGDYEANICAMKEQTGHIATVRDAKASMDDVPCPHCFGFFSSKYLFRHATKCFTKCFNEIFINKSCTFICSVYNLLLSKMNRDELHQNDDTLLLYAAVQMQMKEKDRYSLRSISHLH